MDNNAKRGRHLKAAPENEHPEQPEKKKKHVGRTVIIVIAAVILVVLLAVFLIFRDLYSQMNTKPRTTPEPTAAPAAVIEATPGGDGHAGADAPPAHRRGKSGAGGDGASQQSGGIRRGRHERLECL